MTRIALALWLLLAALPGLAEAQSRVALVIGNAAYRSVPALPNPLNDAADVGAALTRLGFSVQTLTNAGFDDMRRAVVEFGRRARGAEMAVVFFAGHGIELNGENWLIPVDAELVSDRDVDAETLGLKTITRMVAGAGKLGLVILDACRINPFQAKMARSGATRSVDRGFARVEPTDNVLVAFAARDGTVAKDGVGRNSPFAAALLKNIETPGLEITFLFRNVRDEVMAATKREQQPFLYGSLSKEQIFLKPGGKPADQPSVDAAALVWSTTKDSTSIAVLEDFIRQFGATPFGSLARARLDELRASQTAARVEAPRPPTATPVAPTLAVPRVAPPAPGASRVALVIGNGRYSHAPALPTAANDANDVAAALGRIGFAVKLVTEGTRDAMAAAVGEFASQARGSDIALVYFAGHGIQYQGSNFLIPVDARFEKDIDIERRGVAVDDIVTATAKAAKLGVVLLDACRDNPSAANLFGTTRSVVSRRGLARVEPQNYMLVGFACKAGTTAIDRPGRNSAYAAALLKHVETPGLDVRLLFGRVRDEVIKATAARQEPFVYGSLGGETVSLALPVQSAPSQAASPKSDRPTAPDVADLSEPKRIRNVTIRPDSPATEPSPQIALPSGSYGVQVTSQRSTADVQAAFRSLQAKYPNVLGDRQAVIDRVDLGSKGVFYRANIGPFTNSDQAGAFCARLKGAGGQCVVVKKN